MPNMNHREVTTQEASENILKTIMMLHIQSGHAYVSEIADHLEMNLTTTYTVISHLTRDGLLQPLEGGRGRRAQKQSMSFTPEGEALARRVFERHQTIQKWLNRLGISMEDADAEACGIEHGISDRTMDLLREHVRMATEITDGKPENASQIMHALMERRASGAMRPEQTFSEKTLELLDRLGGTEGISRKQALVERAQGEENLECILELVEKIGGAAALKEQYGEYLRLRALAERCGGYSEMEDALTLVEELGGQEPLWALLMLSRHCGGVEGLLERAEEQYRFWQMVFQPQSGKTAAEPV